LPVEWGHYEEQRRTHGLEPLDRAARDILESLAAEVLGLTTE
jgi:hypothetical protein